jgi:uncharacterized membrane protein
MNVFPEKHPVVRGHPIHGALSDGPAALAPVAFIAQLWSVLRRSDGSRSSARAITRFAWAASLAAGVAGWWDWSKMPRDHPAWRDATVHGVSSSTLVGVLTVAAFSNRRRTKALGLAAALVGVGGWLGGRLVFHHGWRVRPVEEFEIVRRELGPMELIERARAEVDDFERRETYVPPS